MPRKTVHIVPREGDWAIQRGGGSRASSIHDTQADAIERGREIAQNLGAELVIHGRDGKIRDSDSYGGDPHPPKDTKH